jgi:hypothetical protein
MDSRAISCETRQCLGPFAQGAADRAIARRAANFFWARGQAFRRLRHATPACLSADAPKLCRAPWLWGGDQVVGVQAKFCYGRIRLFEMQSVVGRPLGLLLLVVKTCR